MYAVDSFPGMANPEHRSEEGRAVKQSKNHVDGYRKPYMFQPTMPAEKAAERPCTPVISLIMIYSAVSPSFDP